MTDIINVAQRLPSLIDIRQNVVVSFKKNNTRQNQLGKFLTQKNLPTTTW